MQTVECYKCGGSGVVDWARHYAEGRCFQCGGTGKVKASDPSLGQIRSRFRGEALHHQIITVAELRNKTTVFIEVRHPVICISMRTKGKARREMLRKIRFTRDNAKSAYRKAWQVARDLAAERKAEFVPFYYLDGTKYLSPECGEAIRHYAQRYANAGAAQFGL